MKILLTLCSLLAFTYCAHAQTGFFLVPDDRDCSHQVTGRDLKQYCITDKPIIDKSEFKAEGNVQREIQSQKQYFNIRFTKAGFEKLKVIREQLPEQKLVLVINGLAIGEFDRMQPRQVIQIVFPSDSKDIETILDALKKSNGG